MAYCLNMLGLISGLVGSVLIFFFGVARLTEDSADVGIGTATKDEEVDRRIKLYKVLSKIGLALLALGFALQLSLRRSKLTSPPAWENEIKKRLTGEKLLSIRAKARGQNMSVILKSWQAQDSLTLNPLSGTRSAGENLQWCFYYNVWKQSG